MQSKILSSINFIKTITKMKKENKTVRAINIVLLGAIVFISLTGCLAGRFGVNGELTTPTDTIRFSDRPKASVTISVE